MEIYLLIKMISCFYSIDQEIPWGASLISLASPAFFLNSLKSESGFTGKSNFSNQKAFSEQLVCACPLGRERVECSVTPNRLDVQ